MSLFVFVTLPGTTFSFEESISSGITRWFYNNIFYILKWNEKIIGILSTEQKEESQHFEMRFKSSIVRSTKFLKERLNQQNPF